MLFFLFPLSFHGYYVFHLSLSSFLYASDYCSIERRMTAIHFFNHSGTFSIILLFTLYLLHIYMSCCVSGSRARSKNEFLIKKEVFLSIISAQALEVANVKYLPLHFSVPQRQIESLNSFYDSVIEQQSKVNYSPNSISLKEYMPIKYLPSETVTTVPQFGSHEWENRLEKFPF